MGLGVSQSPVAGRNNWRSIHFIRKPYGEKCQLLYNILNKIELYQSTGETLSMSESNRSVSNEFDRDIGLVGAISMRRACEEGDYEEKSPTISSRSQVATREHEYGLLIPIARTENVEQLMRTAVDIAKRRDAEILVMSAVTMPAQITLTRTYMFVDEEKNVVHKAIALIDGTD